MIRFLGILVLVFSSAYLVISHYFPISSTLEFKMRKLQLPSLDGATIEDIQSRLTDKLFTSQEPVKARIYR